MVHGCLRPDNVLLQRTASQCCDDSSCETSGGKDDGGVSNAALLHASGSQITPAGEIRQDLPEGPGTSRSLMVMLSDYGLPVDGEHHRLLLAPASATRGDTCFADPEFLHKGTFPPACDIFSLGKIIELVLLNEPLQHPQLPTASHPHPAHRRPPLSPKSPGEPLGAKGSPGASHYHTADVRESPHARSIANDPVAASGRLSKRSNASSSFSSNLERGGRGAIGSSFGSTIGSHSIRSFTSDLPGSAPEHQGTDLECPPHPKVGPCTGKAAGGLSILQAECVKSLVDWCLHGSPSLRPTAAVVAQALSEIEEVKEFAQMGHRHVLIAQLSNRMPGCIQLGGGTCPAAIMPSQPEVRFSDLFDL
eukprot:TRINITY_DN9418_c0_g3_i1.p1 TRINITY_DN9418_c0_g3~~TRINITY_DN9418_c0_g3_i1.p1  ORF type:complete len:399 (+),score=14.55 TRINITY_DN9418_c0_g3_i1:110-1198(+)